MTVTHWREWGRMHVDKKSTKVAKYEFLWCHLCKHYLATLHFPNLESMLNFLFWSKLCLNLWNSLMHEKYFTWIIWVITESEVEKDDGMLISYRLLNIVLSTHKVWEGVFQINNISRIFRNSKTNIFAHFFEFKFSKLRITSGLKRIIIQIIRKLIIRVTNPKRRGCFQSSAASALTRGPGFDSSAPS